MIPKSSRLQDAKTDSQALRSDRLLYGICPEAAELLKDKHIPLNTFRVLRKMRPMRQIEVAERMIGVNCYTTRFAESLLASTPQSDLLDSAKLKKVRGLTD